MIVTEILGNVNTTEGIDTSNCDYVVFDNESRVKRIQRVTTEQGTELGIRLNSDFREFVDGDILAREGETLIVAKIEASDVLVIEPATIREALEVAHALGNRHLQAQFFAAGENAFDKDVMVVRYDHTVEHHIQHTGVSYHRGEYVMPKAFRHAEHTH
ncbi:urease accessory protein UreE [Corynebacterium sp. NML130628]|uniref:urease accessory protein UreE n=1 Tax=Corynebacterium sp. NML130628 TaxID=1906333 RepID=UPI0008FAEE48|nr:urease accessory protein UreE [Corynebacterium sp. NML130628]OIR46420.1 Urease accessory protein UreE [Corynebacterium sp. NML130628]